MGFGRDADNYIDRTHNLSAHFFFILVSIASIMKLVVVVKVVFNFKAVDW